MSNKIQIVTDSTADLPKAYIKENNIEVIPLYVNFPDKTYLDGVDLQPHDFYPMLENSKNELPKTSTPSMNDFKELYEKILSKGHDILSIHISSGLSGTASIASSAASVLDGNIHVFDSKGISFGIGLQVHEAVEMIKKNFSFETIINRLSEIRQRTEMCFSLDTLEYLEKGGRIGKVSALLGTVLNIKPVVRVDDGIYVPIAKVRNQKQALKKMADHMFKTIGDQLPKSVAISHGAAEEAAYTLKEMVENALDIKVTLLNETGPVIGVHTGPGTIGLAFTY